VRVPTTLGTYLHPAEGSAAVERGGGGGACLGTALPCEDYGTLDRIGVDANWPLGLRHIPWNSLGSVHFATSPFHSVGAEER